MPACYELHGRERCAGSHEMVTVTPSPRTLVAETRPNEPRVDCRRASILPSRVVGAPSSLWRKAFATSTNHRSASGNRRLLCEASSVQHQSEKEPSL
jgi:hypothetical protein